MQEAAVGAPDRLMRDQQGKRRMAQDSTGRAAAQQFVQMRVVIATHHQEVCTGPAALCDEHVGSLVFFADRA
jgi:hypothetical protein